MLALEGNSGWIISKKKWTESQYLYFFIKPKEIFKHEAIFEYVSFLVGFFFNLAEAVLPVAKY